MPTQGKGYYTKDGTRVPSVTTVIGAFSDKSALIDWSARMAGEYVRANLPKGQLIARDEVLKIAEQAKANYRDVRDAAADAGTLAHAAVEDWIRNRRATWPKKANEDVIFRAKQAFASFLEWAKQTQLKMTYTELPLISEKYRYGGTFDAMLVQGRRALGDWKTSSGLYPDMLIQVAAYGMLWEENYPDMPIEGGYHIIRFDKQYADFHHHHWAELEVAKQSFLMMRQLYENAKELRKRAG